VVKELRDIRGVKFGLLQMRECEISLRKWPGSTAHLGTSEGALVEHYVYGKLLQIFSVTRSVRSGWSAPVLASLLQQRLCLFWQHDTTVSGLLVAFKAFNWLPPPFAACVILELHEKKANDGSNAYIVRAFYK